MAVWGLISSCSPAPGTPAEGATNGPDSAATQDGTTESASDAAVLESTPSDGVAVDAASETGLSDSTLSDGVGAESASDIGAADSTIMDVTAVEAAFPDGAFADAIASLRLAPGVVVALHALAQGGDSTFGSGATPDMTTTLDDGTRTVVIHGRTQDVLVAVYGPDGSVQTTIDADQDGVPDIVETRTVVGGVTSETLQRDTTGAGVFDWQRIRRWDQVAGTFDETVQQADATVDGGWSTVSTIHSATLQQLACGTLAPPGVPPCDPAQADQWPSAGDATPVSLPDLPNVTVLTGGNGGCSQTDAFHILSALQGILDIGMLSPLGQINPEFLRGLTNLLSDGSIQIACGMTCHPRPSGARSIGSAQNGQINLDMGALSQIPSSTDPDESLLLNLGEVLMHELFHLADVGAAHPADAGPPNPGDDVNACARLMAGSSAASGVDSFADCEACRATGVGPAPTPGDANDPCIPSCPDCYTYDPTQCQCQSQCGTCQQCTSGACQPVPNCGTWVYCNCNQTCYQDEGTCLNDCQVSLGCFSGICGPAAAGQCPGD